MDSLDWQTEEEGDIGPEIAPPTRPRSRSLLAIVILLVLATVIGVVYWQLELRAKVQDENAEEDVLAAFRIWQQAVTNHDEDLLATLMMDGEPAWTAVQRELLASDRLLDRPVAGLSLTESAFIEELSPAVKLSSDWRAAELTFPVSYLPISMAGSHVEVQLEQTVSLTREGSRWLLRRPDDEFWGDWQTVTGRVVTLEFRERDTVFAERMATDLDRDLQLVCAKTIEDVACPLEAKLVVRLESDPAQLLKNSDPDTPSFSGQVLILPSPTLVGKPLTDDGYRFVYEVFATPILNYFESSLASPLHLPEQQVAIICYDHDDRLPSLFIYDPTMDHWSEQLKGSAFRYLVADPEDSVIALQEYFPREPNRLQIVEWGAEQSRVVYDDVYPSLTSHSIGWVSSPNDIGILLVAFQGTTRVPSYQLIARGFNEATPCLNTDCGSIRLEGFPVWSPNVAFSVLQDDGTVSLADGYGRTIDNLGEGYSPFWIDSAHYGFIRTLSDRERLTQEVVIGQPGQAALRVLLSTGELELASIGLLPDKPLFLSYGVVSGEQPERLLLYGRQYAGTNSHYVFLSLALPELTEGSSQIEPLFPVQLELLLSDAPADLPLLASPLGHVPFIVSPDGRWLTTANVTDTREGTWQIHAVEIGQPNRIQQYVTNNPGYTFSSPFFDWSADGQWLLILDEGFIRLAAPSVGYERIVAHDKENCSYPAWIYVDPEH